MRNRLRSNLFVRSLEDRTVPALLSVSTTADSGGGSLRDVIAMANTMPGHDTIAFPFFTSGTITLTSGQIAINDALTIQGLGSSKLTVSGNNATRIFDTSGAPTGAVITINGMTLTAGNSSFGGAISVNNEALILNDCVFSGNKASFGGAVDVAVGTLSATDCRFVNNTASSSGGAINTNINSKTTLLRCTLSGNAATGNSGGAIFARNNLVIDSSTLSGNSSFLDGGAIFAYEKFAPGAFYILNTTISGNSASNGGAIRMQGPYSSLLLVNSTVTNNSATFHGGGIRHTVSFASIQIESSIIAQNKSGSGTPDGALDVPTAILSNNSIIGVADKGNFGVGGVGNQVGTLASPLDAKLFSLADNGGPTLTHMIQTSSPARDKGGNVTGALLDQRGMPRRVNNREDIGAVEYQNHVIVTNTDDSGPGSLRLALQINDILPDTKITFSPTVFATPQKITLASELAINFPVTMVGPGADLLTISGNNASRIFNTANAAAQSQINISGLTLTEGGGTSNGGAIIVADEQLSLTDCVLTGNSASSAGGAIYLNSLGGHLTLERCSIIGNTALTAGGVFVGGGKSTVVINESLVANNAGGGLAWFNNTNTSTATIRNSTISGNSGSEGGGVLLNNFNGMFRIQNSTITNNSVTGAFFNDGGGIAVGQGGGTGSIIIESTIVSGNFDTSGGTAPDVDNAPLSFSYKSSAIGSSKGLVGAFDLGANLAFGENLLLGPLANNGGKSLTHLPATTSPLANVGFNPAGALVDQRGLPRSYGLGIDMGATEITTAVVRHDGDSGPNSLRQAIIDANAVPGANTITFDAVAFAATDDTITLTSGKLEITDAVTIIGPGASAATITFANFFDRLDSNSAPTGAKIAISNLTFANSNTTGQLLLFGAQSVALTDCVIRDNTGSFGGPLNGGSALTLVRCVITGNKALSTSSYGGGVAVNGGYLTVRDSTISGNSAGLGGAIGFTSNGGGLLIENSVLAGNKSTEGGGGAVLLQGTSVAGVTIRNSTLSGNQAKTHGGGVGTFGFKGTINIENTTMTLNSAANGGGIGRNLGTATVHLVSSIVSGNTATTAGPDLFTTGTVNATRSLIGSSAGVTTFTPDALTNLLLGQPALLGPLANNGGPTLTHALLANSPAINNGFDPLMMPNDQRGAGFFRNVGAVVDIGAFELQTVPTKVSSLKVNDGSVQRSRVTSLQITFASPPVLPAVPADGFQLRRQSDSALITLNAALSGNVVTLSFVGGPLDFGSLADGRYTLTALASKISNLDGNGDGTPGDDYVLVGTPANGLFRLFGDADGNGTVNTADFNAFRSAFGGSSTIFDFDNAGGVGTADFNQFRTRFGSSV